MMTGRFEAFGWGGNHGTGARESGCFFPFFVVKNRFFPLCVFSVCFSGVFCTVS